MQTSHDSPRCLLINAIFSPVFFSIIFFIIFFPLHLINFQASNFYFIMERRSSIFFAFSKVYFLNDLPTKRIFGRIKYIRKKKYSANVV